MDEQDLNLVALSPTELPATQAALSEWCVQKQTALTTELTDLQEHLLIATANGWKLQGLKASIRRTEQRIQYYDKIKTAVEAGYLLVPNFPVTVLAVRVARAKQREVTTDYKWNRKLTDATPELLPAGEGRYVDDAVFIEDKSFEQPDGKGGTTTVRRYVSGDYDAPDFPYAMVKPAVLAATERAMALKVFDAVGMVANTGGRDPIMVGQILEPGPRWRQRRATFFIAWWLDTRTL